MNLELWLADLRLDEVSLKGFEGLLAADERDRLERYSLPDLRRRFLATRGITRDILGNALKVDPRELVLVPQPQGKPEVVFPRLESPFSFSLSHTGDLLMLAYGFAPEVGLDVETIRPAYDPGPIIRRFFSEAEADEWKGLPEEERVRGFFRAWTRKEAILKATGLGISGLGSFEVSFASGERKALRRSRLEPGSEHGWWFADLEPRPGFQACVAAPFPFSVPRIRDWKGE